MSKAKIIRATNNYELILEFENGEKRILDIKPYFSGKVFKELEQNFKLFKTAVVDRLGGVEWENGACLSPETVKIKSKKVH